MSKKYFVWIAGLRGPEPQVWAESDMTRDGKPIATLAKHEIDMVYADLGLNWLAIRYPYEAKL